MYKSKLITFVEEKFDILETILILVFLVSTILMINTIPYSIKNAEVMSIYSIKGELVEQLTLTPGDNKVVVSTDNMPSGIYIYRIGGATSKFVVR